MVRPLVWMGSSKRDFGFGLYLAQVGRRHESAKVLRGFGDAGVPELIESDAGGTYRAVYAVRFPKAVFVLHVFQKKSTSGVGLPKPDARLITSRLAAATRLAKELDR